MTGINLHTASLASTHEQAVYEDVVHELLIRSSAMSIMDRSASLSAG